MLPWPNLLNVAVSLLIVPLTPETVMVVGYGEASAQSFGMSTSYLAVTEFLRHYFQIGASDTPDAIRERVTRKLAEVDESLMPLVAPLLALLDPVIDTARTEPAPSPASRRRMLDAVKQLIFGESTRQPMLLVLEDLHSIDPESQALIDGLVDGLSAARFMLLVSYRPEYQHGWRHMSAGDRE